MELNLASISALLGIGRSGPETVDILGDVISLENEDGQTRTSAVLAVLEMSLWSTWDFEGSWDSDEGSWDPDDQRCGWPMGRIDEVNNRNVALQCTTQEAAATLLRAARLVLFALSTPPLLSLESSASSSSTSAAIPLITFLPYEILNMILSFLSPADLSSKQHRIVMNYAEDRSTLTVNKADSQIDFLRRTNCWKWESEIDRVNQGFGYE